LFVDSVQEPGPLPLSTEDEVSAEEIVGSDIDTSPPSVTVQDPIRFCENESIINYLVTHQLQNTPCPLSSLTALVIVVPDELSDADFMPLQIGLLMIMNLLKNGEEGTVPLILINRDLGGLRNNESCYGELNVLTINDQPLERVPSCWKAYGTDTHGNFIFHPTSLPSSETFLEQVFKSEVLTRKMVYACLCPTMSLRTEQILSLRSSSSVSVIRPKDAPRISEPLQNTFKVSHKNGFSYTVNEVESPLPEKTSVLLIEGQLFGFFWLCLALLFT